VKIKVDLGFRVSADTMACRPSSAEPTGNVLPPEGAWGLILAGRSVQRPAPTLVPDSREEVMRPSDSRADALGILRSGL